ncbi:sensor histidine kinase [Nonomuraea sp. SBT364]|uniref:sensor histidine kinase n=1 Tax=Nonomuraea sp. SBT364 TaxID=1580530 RepID=UPI00066E8AC2|nr:histidine kinase [Nonomuraea sp. SBT364]
MPVSSASLTRRLSALSPRLLDGALAATLVVGSWLWELLETGKGLPADAVSLTLTALVNAPLALRRRTPLPVLVVSAAAALIYHLLGYHPGLNDIGPLLALYTVAAHASWRATAAGTALVVAEWTHASDIQPGVALWSALGQSLIVAAWAVTTGTIVRLLGERGRKLASLAEQVARERDASARTAVTGERVRIARELHDVVAHHMSVISVQAGLGRYVALSDPPTAHSALAVIADTSHEALTEMRRLLSLLRTEAGEAGNEGESDEEVLYSTMPGLGGLDMLASRMRVAGLNVLLHVAGRARPLPPGLDLCAYRIVQESLTNVLKHAAPARVDISVTYAPDTLTLRVTDDGAARPASGATSDGHGLIGMTERVRLYHGTISASPLPTGGFEVLATFPLSPA